MIDTEIARLRDVLAGVSEPEPVPPDLARRAIAQAGARARRARALGAVALAGTIAVGGWLALRPTPQTINVADARRAAAAADCDRTTWDLATEPIRDDPVAVVVCQPFPTSPSVGGQRLAADLVANLGQRRQETLIDSCVYTECIDRRFAFVYDDGSVRRLLAITVTGERLVQVMSHVESWVMNQERWTLVTDVQGEGVPAG